MVNYGTRSIAVHLLLKPHVEHFGVERLRITREQIGDLAGIADGSDDAVAAPRS